MAKKAEEAKRKLTVLQENCMHLEEYAYAAFDKLVDMDGSSRGGIAVALAMTIADGGEEGHPKVDTLTPDACVDRYNSFMKNASAEVEKDGIPYFQLHAIKHSMENDDDGILKVFNVPLQGKVVGIYGPAVGLSQTPHDWKIKLGVSHEDIREMWHKIAPGKDLEDAATEASDSKEVFGQDVFDAMFKAKCVPNNYEGPSKHIHMGCHKLLTEKACKGSAECDWLKPWDGDFDLE